MKVTIYGAGMAGLLAAHMLRRFEPVVFDQQASLPNNHDALLRFRSDAVSKATGIPFKKVQVQKGIWYKDQLHTETNLRFNNMYAAKVTGKTLTRSILKLDHVDRYIAPPDFIKQLAVGIDIHYNHKLEGLWKNQLAEAIISTIPMPYMMDLAGWKDVPKFESRTIHTISMELQDVDVYQTIYYPDSDDDEMLSGQYRASITGNKLMIEIVNQNLDGVDLERYALRILSHFGICPLDWTGPKVSTQRFGKIVPIDDQIRKAFILALTDQYNIYSLGRFGTWRQLLLDDVVEDVRFIEQCITQRDSYASRLAAAR